MEALDYTKEEGQEYDKALNAIREAQKKIGHGTYSDLITAGVSNPKQVVNALIHYGCLKFKYDNEELGQLETKGARQFVREWDKRQIEDGMKVFEQTPHGDRILVLEIFSKYIATTINRNLIVSQYLSRPEYSSIDEMDLDNIIKGLLAARFLEQPRPNVGEYKITTKGTKHLIEYFEGLERQEKQRTDAIQKKEGEDKIKEEKENREWELKMRTEERDKLKVELQESQRNIQKRQLRISIVSLVVGIILGAGGMLLKYETNNSQSDRNNSDNVNKGQLIIQNVDTLVK